MGAFGAFTVTMLSGSYANLPEKASTTGMFYVILAIDLCVKTYTEGGRENWKIMPLRC